MGNLVTDDATDRHAAVHLSVLSPTFIKWLERMLSVFLPRNGGYMEVTIRFVRFRIADVRLGSSFNEQQWRNDYRALDMSESA